MIKQEDVLKIHKLLIDQFGGSHGVRDESSLNSAINRPFATFDQQELYPEPVDKAAAILESIVTNHPFIDGNKRTGYVLARLLLLKSGLDIKAT
jgi:death on curing protein